MSRYIDADALIKEKAYASDMWDRETQSFDLPIVDARDIDDAPYIDIVRCKECKYCSTYDTELFCSIHTDDVLADDFCSYGEREGE